MLSVWCPTCAKHTYFLDDEGSQHVLCSACGQKYLLPSAPLLPPFQLGAPLTYSQPLPTVDMDFVPVATFQPVQATSRSSFFLTIAASCIVALILGLSIWGSLRAARTARLRDHAAANQILSEADALLAQGKKDEAQLKYEQLSDFVAYRKLHDASLVRLATAAQSGQEKINALRRVRQAPAQMNSPQLAIATPAPPVVRDVPPVSRPQTRESPTQNNDSVAEIEKSANPGITEHQRRATPAVDGPPNPAHSVVEPPPIIARPAIRLVIDPAGPLPSDEQIGQSIQRGVDWLIQQFDLATNDLHEGRNDGRVMHTGMDALAVYALLQCGQAINDPRLSDHGPFMKAVLEGLKKLPVSEGMIDYTTYSRSIRATALGVLHRKDDHDVLAADTAWLLHNQRDGAYTYAKPHNAPRGLAWDNSNSQYGLLGVWSASEAGFEIPMSYWMAVQKHWESCQSEDGGWDYYARPDSRSTLTMTCAGVASLFVCHDWIDVPRSGSSLGREPFAPSLRRGLEWLEQGDRSVNIDHVGYWGYALYGIERVGLASGFKYFGSHNWYPELCGDVIRRQGPGGYWGTDDDEANAIIDTSYALLFLSRGRHPILMNKLRFDGYWSNHPRDLANLSRFASAELERPLNWQVVPLNRPWTDWTDSPLLYIASHEAVPLTDADVDNLRGYVNSGGMLFLQADGDSPKFNAFAGTLAKRLFPQYELTDVPPAHPVFSSLYNFKPPVPLRMVSNGSRILMLYSPQDISRYWHTRDSRSLQGKPIFQLGMNIFIYAAGKRDLRNRLDNNVIPQIAGNREFTVSVARVRYKGNWDPEPYAWQRFAASFEHQTGYRLQVTAVDTENLDAKRFPIAHLTGTRRFDPTSADLESMRRYVEAGGLLLIDNCGGGGEFDQNLRPQLLSRGFSQSDPIRINAIHPLLNKSAPGMQDLTRPHLRSFAVELLGGNSGVYLTELSAGRGHIILAPIDITSGLLNTNTWGILGYDPAYSQALMKNLILWTLDGQKDE